MELTANKVDMWYDRYTRLWIIQVVTAEGYQIGDALYEPNKKLAKQTKRYLESKHLKKA